MPVRGSVATMGGPLNTVTWTCRVESHAEMGALGEKLAATLATPPAAPRPSAAAFPASCTSAG